MNQKLRNRLIKIARKKIVDIDPSHDFEHAIRVLINAEKIAKEEGADPDIIVPSALFHDLITYPKDSSRNKYSTDESAKMARHILMKIKDFPKEKIERVCLSIQHCSFSKGLQPKFLEAQILQDADGLEATGAISIMRTFSSAGQMGRLFYNPKDAFCRKRQPKPSKYGLDLFYVRLLKIADRMHTVRAKKIAQRRTRLLKRFLKELELELKGK